MPELSPSAEFLDTVAGSVRDALVALDRHEATLAAWPAAPAERQRTAVGALGRLEASLAGWQSILGDMAERVRAAQEELTGLDADLRRSLDTFATARKHLQSSNHRDTEKTRSQI
jgi:hypothetical protein